MLENHGNDQYSVKVDGTGRVTRRNRRYLRHYTLPEAVPLNMPTNYPIGASSQVPGTPTRSQVESKQLLSTPIFDDGNDLHPSTFQGANENASSTPDGGPIRLDAANEMVPAVAPKQKPEVKLLPTTPQSPSSSAETPMQKSQPSTVVPEYGTSRPKRVRCQAKMYDASTGKWT